jgi:hypothetical protein
MGLIGIATTCSSQFKSISLRYMEYVVTVFVVDFTHIMGYWHCAERASLGHYIKHMLLININCSPFFISDYIKSQTH